MSAPLGSPCRVCGKLDSFCWSQVPVPEDHIGWLRENTAYDGRLLSECKTHLDRCSMGHLYIRNPAGHWNLALYDDDGIDLTSPEPPAPYLTWLRRFRRASTPLAALAPSRFSL